MPVDAFEESSLVAVWMLRYPAYISKVWGHIFPANKRIFLLSWYIKKTPNLSCGCVRY